MWHKFISCSFETTATSFKVTFLLRRKIKACDFNQRYFYFNSHFNSFFLSLWSPDEDAMLKCIGLHVWIKDFYFWYGVPLNFSLLHTSAGIWNVYTQDHTLRGLSQFPEEHLCQVNWHFSRSSRSTQLSAIFWIYSYLNFVIKWSKWHSILYSTVIKKKINK